MTTRIAPTFSCTTPFTASYLRNISLKYCIALGMSTTIITPRNAIATRNTSESFALMENAMNSATISVTGARVQICRII